MKYEYKYEIPLIKSIAKRYYDEKTYKHAARVAAFVQEDPRIMLHEANFRDFCYVLAICHDLFEDTDCPRDAFDEELVEGIDILTKKQDESYSAYCKRISMRDSDYFMRDVELAAWYVKLADMKDHLIQTATLTDKLKKKYLEGLPYLL